MKPAHMGSSFDDFLAEENISRKEKNKMRDYDKLGYEDISPLDRLGLDLPDDPKLKLPKSVIRFINDAKENIKDFRHAVKTKDNARVQEMLIKSKRKITPVVRLVRQCVGHAASMREAPNVADYIDLAFSCKETVEELMGPQTPSSYFANDDWQPFFNSAFHEFIIDLISHIHPKKIRTVKSSGTSSAFVAEIDDCRFGWATTAERIDYFCIGRGGSEKAFKIVEKMFWTQYKTNQIIVGVEKDKLSIKEDVSHTELVKYKKSIEYTEYIKEFFKQGVSRSILFYGPPGSGKSSCVKGIISCLNARSVRFTDLESINNSLIAEIIRAFNPDAIVLEDIDHNSNEEVVDLLDKLEDFNNQKKLIFATANQVSKLDNALLRPGRFDEVVEIKKLDEEVLRALVGNDEQILKITKDFPVAFTVELLKRIKVLGKEKALSNMDDLVARIENLDQINYELRADGGYGAKVGRAGTKKLKAR
jgi:hypothetical protein